MAEATSGKTEELWHDCPLFAPDAASVPNLSEGASGEDIPESVGALSHLLYDEDTPEEIAEELREQGNTLFKQGSRLSYIRAVAKYSEALKACDAADIRASALANRAAAHLKLQNHGKALADAEEALKLNGDHVKSRYRAASCCVGLRKFDKALVHCDGGLASLKRNGMEKSSDASLFLRLRDTAMLERSKLNAHESAMQERMQRVERKRSALAQSLAERSVTMGLPLYAQQRTYSRTSAELDGNGEISWPVLVVYPDFGGTGLGDQSDYLESVNENASIGDVIASLFPEGAPPPPWDVSGAYSRRVDHLVAQYRSDWTILQEDADSEDERDFVGSSLGANDVGPWKRIARSTSIADLVRRPDYVVPLFPVVYIVPA